MTQLIVSIVIPIYNEEENISELYRRLQSVIKQIDGDVELIFVDDGSRDNSLNIIRNIYERDYRFKYISLARNFGHQVAVTAGLNNVSGQVVVVMDADLQDPPEIILAMIEKWRKGYQVVYAQRIARKKESVLKRFTAYAFYRILRRLADVNIPPDTGDFCLMDSEVVDILNSMPERNRYIRGLRAWVGFQQTAIPFERDPRFAGAVKYSFAKSWTLAINGIISFSRVPLKLATYLGMLSAGAALLMILLVLYWRLFDPASPLIGYTLITIALFFLGSVQLFCIGILGEYIGRIYEEIKGRPIYTVKEMRGVGNKAIVRSNK